MKAVRLACIAAAMLTSCVGCAVSHGAVAPTTVQPSVAQDEDPGTPVYSPAATEVRVLATHFAKRVVEYHARSQRRRDFLHDLRRDATSAEMRRLRHAPRSRLSWRVLRSRAEHTRLTITGVSDHRESGSAHLLVVEGILTTATDFARVRRFVEFQLTVTRTRFGWRIARAEGPAL